MNVNVWTSEAVVNAVMQGNPNLEVVMSNYFKAFILRLGDYEIRLESITSIVELNQKVLEGISQLEALRKEFLSVVEMFALSNHAILEKTLPAFFKNLIGFYVERDINLYSGESADMLNSVTSILLENQCFGTLKAILHDKYNVFYPSYRITREINFIRYRAYNYTLNQFMNTAQRISVVADYIKQYSAPADFEKLIRADILLYYISLWHHTDDNLDAYWWPELSVYNQNQDILPYMASKKYFEKAKTLFGVNTIEEYKRLLTTTPDILERNGLFRVPMLPVGLEHDVVGSVE